MFNLGVYILLQIFVSGFISLLHVTRAASLDNYSRDEILIL